jgi:hypothetical protein
MSLATEVTPLERRVVLDDGQRGIHGDTWGHRGIHGDTEGYRGIQGDTGGYRESGVKRNFRGLRGKRNFRGLRGKRDKSKRGISEG